MKTIDTSLNLKIKQNDARIKALINHNTSVYLSNYSNQQRKFTKIPKNSHHDNVRLTKKIRQKMLPKTMTTRDIGHLSTNPNTNSQSVSVTSLHKQNQNNYNRLSMTRNNTKIYKYLKCSPFNYRNSQLYNKVVSKTSKNNESFKKNHQKKNKVNLNEMIERFKIDQNKKKEKIEKLKKLKEEKELQKCSHKPTINKKTKNIMNRTKTDFFTRQSELVERKKKNEARLKEIIEQKEQDKIFNTSYIYQKKLKETSSKGGLSNSMISDLSSITRSRKEINDSVKRLIDWGEERKKRLSKKISDKNYSESVDHIPKIDKRSSSLANKKNSKQKYYVRLSKKDETIQEKNRLLAEILKPSFKPNLFLSKKYGKIAKGNISEDNINVSKFNSKEKNNNNLVLSEHSNSSRIPIGIKLKKNGKKNTTKISLIRENDEFDLENKIRSVVIKNLFKKSKKPKTGNSITSDV